MQTPQVYDRAEQLPQGLLDSCRPMPFSRRVLMCAPDYFAVNDKTIPRTVDGPLAQKQWHVVKSTFEKTGLTVSLVQPVTDCEDMVFTAQSSFPGLDATGARHCILSLPVHASRRRETKQISRWLFVDGYEVVDLSAEHHFEGSADAIWHPGKALIWGGHGSRSDASAYPLIGARFSAPVIRLALKSERFYHLSTCFAALDEQTALIHPPALDPAGIAIIRKVFRNVIECDANEAERGLACNVCAFTGRHVVTSTGNPLTAAKLRKSGFNVHELDISEFLKAGANVYAMKTFLFEGDSA